MKTRIGLFLLLTLALALCASCVQPTPEAATATIVPTATATSAPTETPLPTDTPAPEVEEIPEGVGLARLAALRHVREQYPTHAPTSDLVGEVANVTPPQLLGSSTYQYHTGDWTMDVQFPIVAPNMVIYHVTLANALTGFRWEGEVKPNGAVREVETRVPVTVEATKVAPTPGAETVPALVGGWTGQIIQLPAGNQFGSYFLRENGEQYGIASEDSAIAAQLAELRGSEQRVRVWGKLHTGVPATEARQILVERLEVVKEGTDVDGWIGTLVKLPAGNQFGGYFEREDGERYDIGSADDAIQAQIAEYQRSGAKVQVWGALFVGVPATEARHIEVSRLADLSGPAAEERDLSSFATASTSSHLPSDNLGSYHAASAVDGSLSTPWAEGVTGPGLGEWLKLEFPQPVEITRLLVDIGYDRDPDDSAHSAELFAYNNRIQRVRLAFSGGEEVAWTFRDERGLQEVSLSDKIVSSYVKLTIEQVYPGSQYDDTCLAEVQVWGVMK